MKGIVTLAVTIPAYSTHSTTHVDACQHEVLHVVEVDPAFAACTDDVQLWLGVIGSRHCHNLCNDKLLYLPLAHRPG